MPNTPAQSLSIFKEVGNRLLYRNSFFLKNHKILYQRGTGKLRSVKSFRRYSSSAPLYRSGMDVSICQIHQRSHFRSLRGQATDFFTEIHFFKKIIKFCTNEVQEIFVQSKVSGGTLPAHHFIEVVWMSPYAKYTSAVILDL